MPARDQLQTEIPVYVGPSRPWLPPPYFPYLLPLSAAGIVLGGLAVLMSITTYLQMRRSHVYLLKQVWTLRARLNDLDLNLENPESSGQALTPSPIPTPMPTTTTPPRDQPLTIQSVDNTKPNPINIDHVIKSVRPKTEDEKISQQITTALESHFTEYSPINNFR